jgi:hypothetical protein
MHLELYCALVYVQSPVLPTAEPVLTSKDGLSNVLIEGHVVTVDLQCTQSRTRLNDSHDSRHTKVRAGIDNQRM